MTRSSSSNAGNASGSKAGASTTARRAARQRVRIDSPPTRASGMHASQRSSGCQPRLAADARADAISAARVSTAARGVPVVPDVWMIAAASACGTLPARCASARSVSRSAGVRRGCRSNAGTRSSSSANSVITVASSAVATSGYGRPSKRASKARSSASTRAASSANECDRPPQQSAIASPASSAAARMERRSLMRSTAPARPASSAGPMAVGGTCGSRACASRGRRSCLPAPPRRGSRAAWHCPRVPAIRPGRRSRHSAPP